MSFKSVLLVIIILVGIVSIGYSNSEKPIYIDKNSSYKIAGYMSQYIDYSRKLTFKQLLTNKDCTKFLPIDGNVSAGYRRDAIWLRFHITRTSNFPDKAYLHLYPPNLHYVDVYVQEQGKNDAIHTSYSHYKSGLVTSSLQYCCEHPEFIFPLSLPINTPTTVYIRLQSTRAINIAVIVSSLQEIIDSKHRLFVFNSSYFAIALFITILNILFFITTKDKIYLYFALYVFQLFIITIASSGILLLLFPAFSIQLLDMLISMRLGIGGFFFLLFIVHLFRDVISFPIRLFLWLMVLWSCITIIAVPLDFYNEIASYYIITFFIVIGLSNWLSLNAIKKGLREGKLYLFAFSIIQGGIIVQYFKYLGWISIDWWNINILQIASLGNMILMFFALMERIVIAERKALSMAKDIEQKAALLANKITFKLNESNKKLEVALISEQEALEQQHRFLSMLSHEYRSPLAVIQGNLDVIKIQEVKDSKYNEEIVAMQLAVHRLVEVMQGSIERSRSSDPAINKGNKKIMISRFINAQFIDIRAMWPRQSFKYSTSLHDHCIIGDPYYLRLALFNILDNACKYSIRNMPVVVSCHADSNNVVIYVNNQGNGLNRGDEAILLEKYRRGNNGGASSGTGLGLWLVRKIIEQHEGSVSLVCNDKEVTVTIRLPLSDDVHI